MTDSPKPTLASQSESSSSALQPRQRFSVDTSTTPNYDSKAIAYSFGQFDGKVSRLHTQLRDFLHGCRQLGRSYALILATEALKDELGCILMLFHHNCEALTLPFRVRTPDLPLNEYGRHTSNLEHFPDRLERLSVAFEDLRERLNEYQESTNESANIKKLIGMFAKDLKYRASCLNHYRDQLEATHVRLHIHSIAEGMGENIDKLVTVFQFLNTYGLPAIQYEQKRDSEGSLNLATVATFFSAVTASMLQISVPQSLTPIISTVNTFWFCSLVLSIGAALNSLLAVAWRRTTYGAHGPRLPLWIYVWMHASAPIFLTFSIACFSTGLAIFTHATKQANHTSVLTLACTIVTSSGLVIICTWIAYEQWGRFATHGHGVVQTLRSQLESPAVSSIGKTTPSPDPVPHSDPDPDPEVQRIIRRKTEGSELYRMTKTRLITALRDATRVLLPRTNQSSASINHPDRHALPNVDAATSGASSYQLFFNNEIKIFSRTPGEIRDLEFSPNGLLLAVTSFDSKIRRSTTEIKKQFTGFQEQEQHNYTTQSYVHSAGKICHQISWSPDGMLLVRLDKTLDLFNVTEQPEQLLERVRTIKRPHSIKSVAWCTASFILSVEKSVVYKLSLEGNVITKYHFDDVRVRDIAIVPRTDLLLVVGRVSFPHKDLSDNDRAEKQLLLYDMATQECKSRNPILNDAGWITVADHASSKGDSYDIIVGHRNQRLPQLWLLSMVQNDLKLKPASVHLQNAELFTGPGHFAGNQHQMICCSEADGDICIWNRETGVHVKRIAAQVTQTGWRCMAWATIPAGTMRCVTAAKDELRICTAVAVPALQIFQMPDAGHSAPHLPTISDRPSHEGSEHSPNSAAPEAD